MSALRAKGLSKSDIDNLKKVFRGDLEGAREERGIDRHELERGIKWLREHKGKHSLSSGQIDKFEEQMKGKKK
jgi:hypothetical protein